jgi:hypothetical protein
MSAYRITAKQCGSYKCKQFENIQQKYYPNMIHKDAGFSLDKVHHGAAPSGRRTYGPNLELVNHGGHAHLVLLREAIQVSEHALVHGGCRCRRRRGKKKARGLGRMGKTHARYQLFFSFRLIDMRTATPCTGQAILGRANIKASPSSPFIIQFGRCRSGVDDAW